MSALPFGIQRVGFRKMPHVPTNTERLQRFRLSLPVQFANTTFNGGGEAKSRLCKADESATVTTLGCELIARSVQQVRPLPASTPLPRREARNQPVSAK